MVAQSSEETLVELQAAITNRDMPKAGQQIRSFWQNHPAELYRLDDAAILYFKHQSSLPANQNKQKEIADSLLTLIENGIAHDPKGPTDWLFRRSILILDYDHFLRQAPQWSFELLQSDFEFSTTFPFILWAEKSAEAYQAGLLPLKGIVLQWMAIDEKLLAEEADGILQGEEAAHARTKCRQKLRNVLPDCSQLQANFSDGIQAGNLDRESYLCFLALHGQNSCAESIWWEKCWNLFPPQQKPSWLYRLAGERELAAGQMDAALLSYQIAAEGSQDHRLKANDLLQIAQIQVQKGNYREAKEQAKASMALCPNWGEPYLRLIQIYQKGIEACDLSTFDKKAVNWLLLELADKMGNADADYAAQADGLSYRLLQLCPTREEARFRGLSEGDTWPLKCWMSTICRVRFQ